jgi:spore coat polysaccharide biosynthesis predicted glycosyltransferase SpsG
MRNPQILILTEGGTAAGFGHIARTGAVAAALGSRGATVKWIIDADRLPADGPTGNVLLQRWQTLPATVIDAIENADAVITDSYRAGDAVVARIARTAQLPVFFDDDNQRSYARGMIIDACIGADRRNAAAHNGIVRLLGPRYAALRPPFQHVATRSTRWVPRTVLITFGGSDPADLTAPVLKLLEQHLPRLQKTVIAGGAMSSARVARLRRIAGNTTTIVQQADAASMKKYMCNADIAITAAGQTLTELACCGVPCLTVCVADNQRRNALEWALTGFSHHCGEGSTALPMIIEGITLMAWPYMRQAMSAAGRRMVDGKGASRIAGKILTALRTRRRIL